MSKKLSTGCFEDVNVYIVQLPPRIQSFVVRKDGVYTICISEALSEEARMKAYRHERFHIENGDFDSNLPTSMVEIRAHRSEK